ncbi:MAG: Ig-like domain-containing protein [Muribaculaceae bacterium]|nr:Ig-like domain-containing protein [Muribaculaceae bacterium]
MGGTKQLTATIAPSNATNKAVTWSSSNTSVATMSSSGLVTGGTLRTQRAPLTRW